MELSLDPTSTHIDPTSILDSTFFQHDLVNSETIYNHHHIFSLLIHHHHISIVFPSFSFSFSFLLFFSPLLLFLISIVFPPHPPNFYSFTSSSSFYCFTSSSSSFYCFPSSSSFYCFPSASSSFLLFSLLHLLLISIVFPRKGQRGQNQA